MTNTIYYNAHNAFWKYMSNINTAV